MVQGAENKNLQNSQAIMGYLYHYLSRFHGSLWKKGAEILCEPKIMDEYTETLPSGNNRETAHMN